MADLIFIDGPPGVGKSTLGAEVAGLLPGSRLLLEMDPEHPLHPVPVTAYGADFSEVEKMDVADAAGLMLGKWKGFLASTSGGGQVVVESYPYQSHLRVLWQMNASTDLMAGWLASLHELLAPHCPLLAMIHFRGDEAQLQKVFDSRGSEWKVWITDFLTGTAYCRARGLVGYTGAMQALFDYHRLLESWSDRWPFARVDFEAWQMPPSECAAEVVQAIGM